MPIKSIFGLLLVFWGGGNNITIEFIIISLHVNNNIIMHDIK